MNGLSGRFLRVLIIMALAAGPAARLAQAHCDTLDGPVVVDARKALERGDLSPVLKWVSKEAEAEVRSAFHMALAVRKTGPEARELADHYFFETVVRLHRIGEGAPFTGLKPAGADLGPAVAGADLALDKGNVEPLVKLLTDAGGQGLRERFRHVSELKKTADKSIEDGRAYVAAYVEFVHYAERLFNDATSAAAHEPEAALPAAKPAHKH